jgi:hypothetical protein
VEVIEVISLASHGILPCLVLVGLECARVPGARPMAPPPNDALQANGTAAQRCVAGIIETALASAEGGGLGWFSLCYRC